MNEERNKQLYRETFDCVHAPEDLLGKVKSMKKEHKVKVCVRRIAVAAAALAVTFVSSNGITYAATGTTWMTGLSMVINGESYQLENIRSVEDTDGTTICEFEMHDQPDICYAIQTSENENLKMPITIDEDAGIYAFLEQDDDGVVYLTAGDERVNVTENLVDGTCKGNIRVDSNLYSYVISENDGEYSVNMTACED